MTRTVDIEQLQTTKSEKLLALVLAAFLLIGGVWAYQEIDDRVRESMPVRQATPAEKQAIRAHDAAQQRRFQTERSVAGAPAKSWSCGARPIARRSTRTSPPARWAPLPRAERAHEQAQREQGQPPYGRRLRRDPPPRRRSGS